MKPGLCLISADAVQSLAAGFTPAAAKPAATWVRLAVLLSRVRVRLARILER
jgi:hypothetical protein